ncbi:MAG: hypothetical protein ACRCZI_11085 [Cetobacterium sp.]
MSAEPVTLTQLGMARFENWRLWAMRSANAALRGLWYPATAAIGDRQVSSKLFDDDVPPPPVDVRDGQLVEDFVVRLEPQLNAAVRFWFLGHRSHWTERIDHESVKNLVERAARELMCKKHLTVQAR